MLRSPNQQIQRPPLHHTEFSLQKIGSNTNSNLPSTVAVFSSIHKRELSKNKKL